MSEKKEGANMLAPADITARFCHVLAGNLESLMAKGDSMECLELVKFLRRYVADMPVTDYRTVGFPKSIKAFLDDIGLKQETDYNISVSSLDSESHVLSFVKTSATETLLGCIAGMRVENGPSVCDNLYSEMCKDEGRDFENTLCTGGQKKRADIRNYVLEKTYSVYKSLADEIKLRENGDVPKDFGMSLESEEEDAAIMKFASSQISDGKLLPTALPVVPIAVAELYMRIKNRNSKNDIPLPLFRLGKDPYAWSSARPEAFDGDAPMFAVAETPIGVMRKVSSGFDEYMPKDAGSFYNTECTPVNTADSVFVMFGAPLRFPLENAKVSVDLFAVVDNPRMLMHHVEDVYRTCYPDLGLSFYAGSSVKVPVGSKYAVKHDLFSSNSVHKVIANADKTLGLDPTDGNPDLLITGSFLMSPLYGYEDVDSLFAPSRHGNITVMVQDASEEKKKKAKDQGINIAEAWFELVHNEKAPGLTESEASEKMEKFLTENIVRAEAGKIPTALAISFRTAITRTLSKSDNSELKAASMNRFVSDKPSPELEKGLHSSVKFITQVISTVAGTGGKSFGQFVAETQSGKVVTAPSYPGTDRLFYNSNCDKVTEFIKIADSSNLQLRAPRRASDFILYAETNLGFDELQQIYENTCGLTSALSTGISTELTKVLFENIVQHGKSWKYYDKVLSFFGESSAIVSTLKSIINGTNKSCLYNLSINRDVYGRAFIAIRVDTSAALLAMMVRCTDDTSLNSLMSMAMKYDPSCVVLSQDCWREELCDRIVEKARENNRRGFPGLCDYLYSSDVSDIGATVGVRSMFSENPVTNTFGMLPTTSSTSEVDPN